MTVERNITEKQHHPEQEAPSPRVNPNAPIPQCDGRGLKRLMKAGLAWLERHQAAINALNVYPVPDGDTGTNMLLTMQSAYKEIHDSPEEEVGVIAQKVAHGALMGARGNSGVILSQIFRGFARTLGGVTAFDTILHVRERCNNGSTEVACNDDVSDCLFESNLSTVEVTLDPGIYYLFLDGWGSESGAYRIETSGL